MTTFVIFFALSSLCGYILGYFVGRCTAEQEFEECRKEMQIDEKEGDPFYDLFKP